MSGTKKSRNKRDISPTHPDAAAIDIGATMHVAAVRPDKVSEPVRSFGTFTGDLHRLADWFKQFIEGRKDFSNAMVGCRIVDCLCVTSCCYDLAFTQSRQMLG